MKYLFIFILILDLLDFEPKIVPDMRSNAGWEREDRLEREIQASLNELFLDGNEDFKLVPKGTRILRILVIEDDALIDFSEEICNYGGSYREGKLVWALLDTAFSPKEIQSVTIAIEGKITYFTEGTLINKYTREEWLKGARNDGE